jgi:hypothetical protein
MTPRSFAALFLLLTSACTPVAQVDTAVVQPLAFGTNQDSETAAINISSWALSNPARTHNDPADAARALAGIDYLAGDLVSNPRWLGLSPLVKQEMLAARVEVRQAIGVAPGARSQDVVNGLLGAANATIDGNPGGAQVALSAPVFTLGSRETYNRLVVLPYLRLANVATQDLNGSLNGVGPFTCLGC